MNATIPCLEETVERGVLSRVAAELLRLNVAANKECGVCSSGPFSAAYLNILRSSGLTRQEEVMKVFSGGIQRVAKLTVDKYEAEAKQKAEAAEKAAKRREEEALEEAKEKERDRRALADPQGGMPTEM